MFADVCVLLNWTHIAIALALSNIASHLVFNESVFEEAKNLKKKTKIKRA